MSSNQEGFVPDRLGGEFTKVPDWLIRVPSRELSPGAKLVYARLVRYGRSTGIAYPRQETLGRELGLSRRQVVDYLRTLKDVGLIESRRVGQGRPNEVRFLQHRWMVGHNLGRDEKEAAHPVAPDAAHLDGQETTFQDESDGAHLDARQDARPDVPLPRVLREENSEETSPRRRDVQELIEKIVKTLGEPRRTQASDVVDLLVRRYDHAFVEQLVNWATADGSMGRSPNYLLILAEDWAAQRGGPRTELTATRNRLRSVK